MFTCAHCGASLASPRQRCKVCNKQRSPSLPTLQGFGDELDEAGLKTLQTPRSEEALKQFELDSPYTVPFASPIPLVPQASSEDFDSFGQSDSTEVVRRSDRSFEDYTISDSGDQNDMTVADVHPELSNTKQSQFESLKSSNFPSSTPPPIPPPNQSLGGVKWRGMQNPFAPRGQKDKTPTLIGVWFNHSGPSDRQNLRQGSTLNLPNTNTSVAKVRFSDRSFSFEERINQEIWCPLTQKTEVKKTDTLRSGTLIMRLTEMTIDETEVISQLSVSIWEVKVSQEQVFYGAFNLFSGISRVGGAGCEIVLPFIQHAGPIFTLELDLNGTLWCMANSRHELWSLVGEDKLFKYGSVLATQGKLFTIVRLPH